MQAGDIHPPQQYIILIQGDSHFQDTQGLLWGRNPREGIGHLQISASVTSGFCLISPTAPVSGEKWIKTTGFPSLSQIFLLLPRGLESGRALSRQQN